MKSYVPLKYLLGMIMMWLIAPVSLIVLICAIGVFNKWTIDIIIFLGGFILMGPVVFIKNRFNATIFLNDTYITNCIHNGTLNFRWIEKIENIESIKITDNEEAKKYFSDCRAKKVLLIDFGSSNVKYISLGLFTNKQIDRIVKDIENRISKLRS